MLHRVQANPDHDLVRQMLLEYYYIPPHAEVHMMMARIVIIFRGFLGTIPAE